MSIKQLFTLIMQRGLAHILGASVINKVIALSSSIIIVRILSKTDFGYYSWAYNIVTIFLIFSGLGISSGILQFCSENISEDLKNHYYKFGLLYGTTINLILSFGILLYAFLFDLSLPDGKNVLISLSFLPFFEFVYTYLLTFLRTNLENKKYARATNINSISHFILMLSGAYLFGIYGYVFGFYLSYFISILYIFSSTKDSISIFINSKTNDFSNYLQIIKYSFVCACNNGLSQMLYVLDVFLVGVIIANPETIASYKASTTIPTAMQFITSSIIIVIYPYFAKNKDNRVWINNNTKRLLGGLTLVNMPIGLVLFICAPIIVSIVYGEKYIDAIPVFRVLAITFVITTIVKIPCGNILAMLRRVRANLLFDTICGILNIFLDVLLIKRYGSIGAAYATLCVVISGSLISGLYLVIILKRKDEGMLLL